MKINVHKIATNFTGEYCYTHARGTALPSGKIFVTTQPLLLSGVDVFYGVEKFTVDGKNFKASPITPCKNLAREKRGEKNTVVVSDCTPLYHKVTGKILLLGHSLLYGEDNRLVQKRPRHTAYAVYDGEKGDFEHFKLLDMGDTEYYFAGNGSGQSFEEENGDLLIPFYYQSRFDIENGKYNASAAVMRCAFDGEKLKILEIGAPLALNVPRGFCEPSVIKYENKYFLCLRNDNDGYLAKSKDGLHYGDLQPLCFDDGSSVGNYCTQQHWLTGGDKLWLVYTRRAENNGHVFRHRAPLFIAEVDPLSLRVIRATEKVVVPERGARLGNFGCCSLGDGRGVVIASEWMQFGGGDSEGWKRCMQYGSDNSIFVSEILFD
ncbi:MAG: exo-alpha-sialidase [Clostridia bacterium]|nr:exo-alpha-sialidase [Clostridia bacterium]